MTEFLDWIQVLGGFSLLGAILYKVGRVEAAINGTKSDVQKQAEDIRRLKQACPLCAEEKGAHQ